jgi:PAS domain S-box-containing protein
LFHSLTTQPPKALHDVRGLAFGRDGTMWAGTHGDGIAGVRDGVVSSVTTRNGLLSDDAARVTVDRRGRLWVITTGGVMRRTNGRMETLIRATLPPWPRFMVEAPDGSMYMSVRNRQILRIKDDVITTIELPALFPDEPALAICPEADGTLWFTSLNRGIYRLRNGHLSAITPQQGVPAEQLFTLIDDGHGYWWSSSNHGIWGFRKSELEAVADGRLPIVHPVAVGALDGMRSVECNGSAANAGVRSVDGTLWFANTRGAVQFDPSAALRRVRRAPAILETTKVDGRMIDPRTMLVPAGADQIEFSYTAIDYSAPSAVHFRYRLEGFDRHWIDAGSRRVALYTRLPPGRYRFRVEAAVGDGAWNESGIARDLVQQPHFYQTRWFAILVLTAIAAALWLLYALRVAALRRRQRELERLVHQRTELLEAASQKNEIILDTAADGIVGIDPAGLITFINAAGASILGWPESDLIGRSLHETIHSSDVEGDCTICHPHATAVRPSGAKLFQRHDGRYVPVDVTSSIMRSDRGAVITFRDVSERVAIEQMKDEFVATVSHELRTPLTAIRGAVGLIGSVVASKLGEQPQRLLNIAVNNCDRLLRLVNELLDSERLVSGRFELRRESVDAGSLMQQAAGLMQAIGEKSGVTVIAEPLDEMIDADADRVIQLLTNLIGNAIKFSPSNGIVRVTAEVRGDEVLFHVADQGRGIPPEKLDTVFERFRQVESSDAHEKGGSGLGLAICRGIVDAHGGRIWVESKFGAGSTFSFALPHNESSVRNEHCLTSNAAS